MVGDAVVVDASDDHADDGGGRHKQLAHDLMGFAFPGGIAVAAVSVWQEEARAAVLAQHVAEFVTDVGATPDQVVRIVLPDDPARPVRDEEGRQRLAPGAGEVANCVIWPAATG
jgi:hypothetical protein